MKPALPPLNRALRDLFRVEPLEPRVLLSADPVLGAAQIVLRPPEQDQAAALAAAYAAPADVNVAPPAGSTVLVANNAQQPDGASQWLLVDTAQLDDGNGRVVVGGPDSNAVIRVGGADSAVQLGELVLVNPQAGGEVFLDGALQLSGSLMIQGSGHTTTLAADTSSANDIVIADSVLVAGNRTLSAGTDGSGSIQLGNNTASTINGNGDLTSDTLVLNAADNVRFTGPVGSTDPLEGITIDAVTVSGSSNLPNNVTFDREITVNGDLIINASGTVTFAAKVVLASGGDLRISGASSVVFQGGLELQGVDGFGNAGDVFIEANEIDFLGGTESVKGAGLLTLRPATVSYGIDLGSLPASPSQPSGTTLNLETSELKALADGFSKIVIGQQDGVHANAAAGKVRIGAIDALSQPTLRDSLEVYGGSISVEDLDNPDYQFLVQGTIKLDAHADITIANRMEANTGSGVTDIELYSSTGKVQQVDATADLRTSEPLRAATLTIQAAAGISLPYTEITTLSAVNLASGDLSITETAVGSDVAIAKLHQQAISANLSLKTTAGSISVGGLGLYNAGSGLTELQAAGNSKNITVNQDIHSVSGAIRLTASGAITTADDAGSATHGVIYTDASTDIELTASGGAIQQGGDITSAGGLVSLDAATTLTMQDGVRTSSQHPSADTGAVSLRARGGNITVSIVEADGSIALTAAGAILDGLTGANPNFDGETAAVLLAAASGIGVSATPLQTRVNSLAASNTTSGGLFVREATALRLAGTETSSVDLGGTDGSMAVYTVDGAITVEKAVRSTGTIGHMLLQSGESAEATAAGIDVRADLTSAHGSMTVLAADGITVDDQLAGSAPTISVTAASQTLDVEAATSISAEANARFATAGGDLRLSGNAGDVALGVADAGSGTVSILAGGRILDAQGDDANATPSANVIASAARLSGVGGIGVAGTLFDTQVTTLAATAVGGSVFMAERDALAIGSAGATTVKRIGTDAVGSVLSDAGTLSGIASSQHLVLQTGGNLSITQAMSAGGNLRLAVAGTLGVSAAVASSGGTLSATTAGTISVSAAGVLAADGGTVDVESTAGAVAMADGALVRSNAANIRVQAAGDVTVGLLDARSAADQAAGTRNDQASWGEVSVVAGGAIVDNAGETSTDIVGSSVRLKAAGAVGAGSEQLETEAGQLSANAGAGLFITEASDVEVQQLVAITVQRVGLDGVASAGPTDTVQGGLTSGAGLVLQTQSGSMVVGSDAAVSAAGNLLLYTQGASYDVTLDSAVSSSGGSISILSTRDLLLNADVSTAAAGETIDLHAARTLAQAQDTGIASNNGNVSVNAGGNATLERITAGTGGVWVSAANVVDGDAAADGEVDIAAASAQLLATSAIGAAGAALETQLATLSASTGTSLFLTESDGVTIDRLQLDVNRVSADASTASTSHAAQEDLSGQTVVVQSLAGDLTLNAGTGSTAAVNGGSGNVRLEAVAGHVIVAASVNAGTGNATVLGAASVTFQGTAGVATTTGTIDVEASAGAIGMDSGAVLQTGGGVIRLKASGDVTVGVLDAGAGSVSVVAGGSIQDNGGETTSDVLAAVLRLQAGGGIGSAAEVLETDVAQLSTSAGGAGIFISEANALTITETAALSVNRVDADGVTLIAQTDAVQAGLTSGGALVLQTVNGTLTTAAQGAIAAAGNVYLLAAGASSDLSIGAAVSSSGGSMQLRGERDALLNANLSTAAQNKSISLSADRDLTQAQGTSAATVNGGIELHASGTVTLEQLSAGTAGVAISGDRIVDGDTAGDSEVDIVTNRAWLLGSNGIGAAGAELETTVDLLRANSASGSLFIAESDAVTLDLVSVAYQLVDANGDATNATSGGDRGLAGANVVLRALNGAISSATGTSVAASGNLLLQAGGANGDISLAGSTSASGAMSLLAGRDATLASTVSTTTAGSSIDIQAQGRIDAQQGSAINANNANVQLLALGGSVTLESVNAGTGKVRISGTSVVDGDSGAGETEVDITAAALLLTATSNAGTGANPLETTVGTLSASAGGIVGIVESDGLVLGSVTTSVDRVGINGTASATTSVTQANVSGTTVTIRTLAGALEGSASGGAVSASGNLLLKASGADGDICLASAVSSSGGNISIDAARDLTQSATISTGTSGKTIDLLSGGNLLQSQGSALTTTNGHVSLAATGTLTIENVSAGIGRVSLSGASIVDGDTDGDAEVDVLGAGVRATATTGAVGSADNPLETTISTLSAVASGDVFVTETNALDLAVVTATVNRVANNGSDAAVNLTAQNNVSGATVVLRTLGGSLSNQASGAVSASGNVLLQAGGASSDLNLSGTVSSSAGHVSLAAGQDIVLGANVSAAGAGKSADLVAGRNLSQAQGTTLSTTDGDIGLQAAGSATLETFSAGAGGLRIAAGSIVDGDTGTNETEVDLTGSSLQLITTGAVGANTNALETAVQTLSASAGANLFLTDNDALTIGALSINTQRVATGGTAVTTANATTSGLGASSAVVQTKAGSLDSLAAVAINASSNLLLKANGTDSDLVLRGAVSAAGDLALEASQDLLLAGAVASTGIGRSLVLQAGRNFSQDQGTSATANDGVVALAAGADATLEYLAAGSGLVHVSAARVIDGDTAGDSEADIAAARLQLMAVGAVGAAGNALETSVGTLTLQAGGDAFVTEADALVIASVAGSSQRVGTDGSSQTVAIDSQSGVTGGGVLVLQTTAGSLGSNALGGAVATAGNVLLAAGGTGSDLSLGASVVSFTGDMSLAAGRDLLLGANVSAGGEGKTIDLAAERHVVQAQGTQVSSANGNIALHAASGNATLEQLSAGSGGLWVMAVNIVDGDAAGDSEVDLSAAVAQLNASAAIGGAGAQLETHVATLAARAGSDVFLTESDALVVGSATVDVRRVDATSASASTAHAANTGVVGATIVLRTLDATLATQAEVVATGNLLLQAEGASGDLDIGGAASALGALSLDASRDVVLASSVSTTGTTIDVVALRAISAQQGSAISSGNGNVLLQAGTNITLESVDAGSGSVRIVSSDLTDGDSGGGETEVDIAASQLQISVTGAVGATTNPVETAIGTLSITAGGQIALADSGTLLLDATTFTGVNRVGVDGITSATGSISQSDVDSTGGSIALSAQGTITMAAQADVQAAGAATIAMTSVAGSVMMDANQSSLRTGSGDIHVTAEADIQPGAIVTSGMAYLDARNGRILIRGDLQRNGEDVDLLGDDLVIEVPVGSPGGTLRIGPLEAGTPILIGDSTPGSSTLQVDTGELALLQDGFAQIVIGSSFANQSVVLDGATNPLVFRDPLLLTATGTGGTVAITGTLRGDTLTIADAGSRTTLSAATLSMQGNVVVHDQLTVDGANSITAGQGGSGTLHFTQAIAGLGGAADTMTLAAGGGAIALDQAVSNLDGLSIAAASDVTFGAAVSLTGDLVIEATGTVTFNGPLTLANGAELIVRGGGRVVFNAGADLGSGDALLQVSGIQATGGAGSLRGQGLLQVQGVTAATAIHVGSGGPAGALVVGDDVLRAVGAGFRALQIGSGATASAGAITLGDADLSLTSSPVTLQGSAIDVAANGNGVRLGTDLTLHAAGTITAAGRVSATANVDIQLASDTGAIAMKAGASISSQGGHIGLNAATGLAVAGLDARAAGGSAGTVSLRTTSGLVTDANADSSVDIYAQAVDVYGRGPAVGSAQVLEVSAPIVRVDPAGGLVLRESGTDGRVYFNVLHGDSMEQVLVAVGSSQRITTDPDTFIAKGGLQALASGGQGSSRTASTASLLQASSFGSAGAATNAQVQGYLGSVASAGDAGLTLSQRLQAESAISFATGQSLGSRTSVDYWTESVSI